MALSFKHHQLPNGLDIVAELNPDAHSVAMGLFVKTGARDESYRFACNTTVGVAGFFDVATRWKIAKSEADFGQTFGQWGWQPRCFHRSRWW